MVLFKMLRAAGEVASAMAATAAAPPPPGTGGPCNLEGVWVPCRHDEWRNRNLGPSHKSRARAAQTKVTYDVQGRGTGKVGELFVQYTVSTIAPGQYTAIAKVPQLLWSASDGNLTLHANGTLEVHYPSNGIVEYWQRADGRRPTATSHAQSSASVQTSGPSRPLTLLLRHFGPGSPFGSSTDLGWHWALAVGEEHNCYEVAGSMAVLGPKGLVAASSPFATNTKPTHISQYDAFLKLPQTTQKSDDDIKSFIRQWVRKHPLYTVLGPNCQTFAEDLFTFCCGQNLPFSKSSSRLDRRGVAPEAHPSTVWLTQHKKPT